MSPESGTLCGSEVLDEVLDNPVWAALTGPHGGFAEFGPAGLAARYTLDTSPFSALADPQDPRAWADLAALAGPGQEVWVTGLLTPPPGWQTLVTVPGCSWTGGRYGPRRRRRRWCWGSVTYRRCWSWWR